MTQTVTGSLAIALYLLSSLLLGKRLFSTQTPATGRSVLGKTQIIAIGLVAVVLHAVTLSHNLFVPEGLNIGFFNAVSLITCLIALLLLLASLGNPVENLGVFLLPVAALAILGDMVFSAPHTLMIAEAMELKLHILMSVLAYSLLSIAAVHAVLLAVQDRHLRNKRPGGFIRALPPLQTMESLLMAKIEFGTDGWRAVIAEDFTFANVARVAQAAADYWNANPVSGTEKKVIVGYDRRFLSDQFARCSAEILAGNGFNVVLTPEQRQQH